MHIVWDLDGVLRDINGYIMRLHGGKYPDKWDFIYGIGKSIYDNVKDRPDILIKAPPTAYCSVMKAHYSLPEIWTHQPKAWIEPTLKWIDRYIGKCTMGFLTREEKEERLYAQEDTFLVEDCPLYKDYNKIILIDRPYNQGVEDVLRIYGTKCLNNVVNMMKGAKG